MHTYDDNDRCIYAHLQCSDDFATMKNNDNRIFLSKSNVTKKPEPEHRRPVYDRTRMIVATQVTIDGSLYVVLQCGCGYYCQRLLPCRHIYALLRRYPRTTDFFPQCHKTYELSYGVDPNYTSKCDDIIKNIKSFGGFIDVTLLTDIKAHHGPRDIDWFMDTWNHLVDTNPKSSKSEVICEFGGADGVGDFGLDITSPHSTQLPTFEPPAKKKKLDAFNRHAPKFQALMNQVNTDEQHDYIERMFKSKQLKIYFEWEQRNGRKR